MASFGTASAGAGVVLGIVAAIAAAKVAVSAMAQFSFVSSTAFAAVALTAASLTSALLYKPWKMGARVRLRERDLVQLGLGAALLAGAALLSVLCLRIAGTWRWSLLEFSDVLVFGALGLLWSAQSHVKSPGQLRRATLLGAIGVVLMLLYTPSTAEVSAAAGAEASLSVEEVADLGIPPKRPRFAMSDGESGLPSRAGDREFAANDGDFPMAGEARVMRVPEAPEAKGVAFQDPAGDAYDSGPAEGAVSAAPGAATNEIGEWLQPRPVEEGAGPESPSGNGEAGRTDVADSGRIGRLLLDAAIEGRSAPRPAAGAGQRAASVSRTGGESSVDKARGAAAPPLPIPSAPSGPQRPTSSRWRARRAAAIAAAKRVRATLDAQTIGSTLLAGAFLVVAAWLNGLRRRLGRALAADTNLGTRRVLALTLAGAACITVPLALANAIFSSGPSPAEAGALSADSTGEATGATAGTVSGSSPSMPWFLFVASLFGCVHFLLGDIALELPLLSSVFGGAAIPGPGPGPAGASSSSSSGGAQAVAIAAQDTAAVRCVLLLLVLTGSSLVCVLGAPALSSQLTLLGLLGACIFYAPAVIAASGLDTRRAVGTLRKRMSAGGAGGGGVTLLPTSLPNSAGEGAATGIAGFVGGWFQGLSDLFLVAGHATGLIADSGGSAADVRDVSRRQERGAGGHRWDDERGGSGGGFQALTRRVLRHVWADANSRKILIFLVINVRETVSVS